MERRGGDRQTGVTRRRDVCTSGRRECKEARRDSMLYSSTRKQTASRRRRKQMRSRRGGSIVCREEQGTVQESKDRSIQHAAVRSYA
ncbi:hypothetical protein FKM82_020338 [Ascaphus truei]